MNKAAVVERSYKTWTLKERTPFLHHLYCSNRISVPAAIAIRLILKTSRSQRNTRPCQRWSHWYRLDGIGPDITCEAFIASKLIGPKEERRPNTFSPLWGHNFQNVGWLISRMIQNLVIFEMSYSQWVNLLLSVFFYSSSHYFTVNWRGLFLKNSRSVAEW